MQRTIVREFDKQPDVGVVHIFDFSPRLSLGTFSILFSYFS